MPRRRSGHDAPPGSGRRRDVGDVGGLEVEELAQGCGVVVAAALHRELLDPAGGGVEQLLDDAVHGERDLGPGLLVEVRQPLVETLHLGRDEARGAGAQGRHGRRDRLLHAPGEVVGHLCGHELADPPDLGAVGPPSRRRPRCWRSMSVTPGQRGPGLGRRHVARQGEVDDDLRATGAQLRAAREGLARDDVPDGPGAGDDEVALGHDVGQLGPRAGAALGARRRDARPARRCGRRS